MNSTDPTLGPFCVSIRQQQKSGCSIFLLAVKIHHIETLERTILRNDGNAVAHHAHFTPSNFSIDKNISAEKMYTKIYVSLVYTLIGEKLNG